MAAIVGHTSRNHPALTDGALRRKFWSISCPSSTPLLSMALGTSDRQGGEFDLEGAVPPIDGAQLARALQSRPRKATKILVFPHQGVIGVPLTADPPLQGLRLRGGRVTAKADTDLS
ncbi:hypothetical protein [Acidiferrobacter sp.]